MQEATVLEKVSLGWKLTSGACEVASHADAAGPEGVNRGQIQQVGLLAGGAKQKGCLRPHQTDIRLFGFRA